MTGYKVSMDRKDCFTGYMKTYEDAKKYAEWIGPDAEIKKHEKANIKTYWAYDENNDLCHLKRI